MNKCCWKINNKNRYVFFYHSATNFESAYLQHFLQVKSKDVSTLGYQRSSTGHTHFLINWKTYTWQWSPTHDSWFDAKLNNCEIWALEWPWWGRFSTSADLYNVSLATWTVLLSYCLYLSRGSLLSRLPSCPSLSFFFLLPPPRSTNEILYGNRLCSKFFFLFFCWHANPSTAPGGPKPFPSHAHCRWFHKILSLLGATLVLYFLSLPFSSPYTLSFPMPPH